MSDAFSKRGYVAISEEATVNTPVLPAVGVELLSESLITNYNNQPSNQIAGSREMRRRVVKGIIDGGGDITFLVDPNTIGYFLNAFFGAPTSTVLEASTVINHKFTPQNTLKTYTIDIAVAGFEYVRRFTGVKIASMAFSQSDNKLQCTVTVMPQGAFDAIKLKTAVAGTGVALNIGQSQGLTTSDTIQVIDKDDNVTVLEEYTVASIVDATNITVGSAVSVQLDIGDFVVIKRNSSLTYTLIEDLAWIGSSQVQVGDDVNNATAENAEDFSLSLTNDIEPRWSADGFNIVNRFPAKIHVKDFSSEGSFKRAIENAGLIDDQRQARFRGIKYKFQSAASISSASAVAATATIGTGDGAVTITAAAAGYAGNNFNLIKFALNSTDDLAASISGNTITVLLANATGSKNTATLVASAIDGLTGVGAAAGGTGADEMVITDNAVTLNLTGGRDASETALLQFDFPNAVYQPFAQNISESNVVEEDGVFQGYESPSDEYGYSVSVNLRNAITSY